MSKGKSTEAQRSKRRAAFRKRYREDASFRETMRRRSKEYYERSHEDVLARRKSVLWARVANCRRSIEFHETRLAHYTDKLILAQKELGKLRAAGKIRDPKASRRI